MTINGGMSMRAWYDILGFERGALRGCRGLSRHRSEVGELISREIERGIAPGRIVLAGFSQGGAVSLYSGLRYPERLAGLVVLSSYLPMRSTLSVERAQANAGLSIFMAHGTDDPVLPLAMGQASRDLLKSMQYDVEWHQYRIPHSVCEPELNDIRHFLFRVLP